MRQVALQRVIVASVQRLFETHRIDAAGKTISVIVARLFGTVQARSAGEKYLGSGQQRRFALQQLAGSLVKRRQLIHAVINYQGRIQRCQ